METLKRSRTLHMQSTKRYPKKTLTNEEILKEDVRNKEINCYNPENLPIALMYLAWLEE
jgi:hypothetical protein